MSFWRCLLLTYYLMLGGFAGSVLCLTTLGTWELQRLQTRYPGEYVCGMFALPYMVLGFVPGLVFTLVLWWRAKRWLNVLWFATSFFAVYGLSWIIS